MKERHARNLWSKKGDRIGVLSSHRGPLLNDAKIQAQDVHALLANGM